MGTVIGVEARQQLTDGPLTRRGAPRQQGTVRRIRRTRRLVGSPVGPLSIERRFVAINSRLDLALSVCIYVFQYRIFRYPPTTSW
jgi:hypothetical protein